ncbi:MAG: adenosine deaminase [Intestinibacillus sp.]
MHPYAKTDLHLHLDGSLRPETLLTLARRQNIALPADTPDELTPYCSVPPDCRSLAEYLACFELPLSVLQTADALRYAAGELVVTLGMQGLSLAEIRFAPQLHRQQGVSQAEAVEAVLAGVRDGQTRYPLIKIGVILCMMSTGRDADNAETARLALHYRGQGVCAVDLAGREGARPMKDYEPLLAPLRAADFPITLHAGEAGDFRNVAKAIGLGARRIGHGTRVASAPGMVQQLVEKGIVLEQCVTSNVQTQCVISYQSHPIRKLFDAGVKIAVCTDNMTVSDTTLAREYQILQDVHKFTEDELATLARYAREAAFVQ